MKTNYILKPEMISHIRHVGLTIVILFSCIGTWTQTVFTDIPDINVNASNPSVDIDLDGDMVTDFTIFFTGSPVASFIEISGPAGNNVLTDSVNGDAKNLSSGVDSVAMGSSLWYYLSSGPLPVVLYFPDPVGSWTGGAICKYIGICFVSGGSNHFGWIWVDVAAGTTPELTIKGYAFNSSPLMPIDAGDGASCTPRALFSASSDTIFVGDCINFSDSSDNSPSSWSWTFTGATPSSSNIQNPTNICYSAQGTFDVQLIVQNSFGADTTNSQITVLAASSVLDHNDPEFIIYPNPTEGKLIITKNQNVEYSIHISDVTGKTISDNYVLAGQTFYELNLSGFPNGLYFARIIFDGKMETHKVILR
jgi:PKD repeat protein